MTTYFLAIGINHYTDRAFRALSCCENDATELHSLFKRNLELGDRASKLTGAVSITDVKNELRRIGQEIRNGDTFVFFFAGHGYQHPRNEDQYLLFPDAEAVLVNKGHRDGMLSISALCDLTEHWTGVARVFILDACRSWLPGRSAEGARFDNEAALAYLASRDPGFGPELTNTPDKSATSGGALLPVILNATRDGQEARELEDRQRGVLALALEQSLENQQQTGQIIYLGAGLLGDISHRMNALLQQGRLGVEQTPFLTPASAQVLIYKPSQAAQHSESPHSFHPNNPKTGRELDERKWRLACLKNTVAAYEEYLHSAPSDSPYIEAAFAKVEQILAGSLPLQATEEDVKQTADASITDSEFNDLYSIAEAAANAVGNLGLIRVVPNSSHEQPSNSLSVKPGISLDVGLQSIHFSNQPQGSLRLKNARTLIIEDIPGKLTQPLLDYIKTTTQPLAIFTRNIDECCVAKLQSANSHGEISIGLFVFSNKPDIGWLEDIAILTGGEISYSRHQYADIISKNHSILGRAKIIESDLYTTCIIDGDSNFSYLQTRSELLKEAIKNTIIDNDIKNFRLRLSNISGGTAYIYVSDEHFLFKKRAETIQHSLIKMHWGGILEIKDHQTDNA